VGGGVRWENVKNSFQEKQIHVGTGLTLMPECRCRTDAGNYTDENADAELTFSRQSGIPAFTNSTQKL
jgi:hypothetical protein